MKEKIFFFSIFFVEEKNCKYSPSLNVNNMNFYIANLEIAWNCVQSEPKDLIEQQGESNIRKDRSV